VQIGKLHSGGQITERRIHTYPFDDENVRCCGSGVCTAFKSSSQSTPRFTITSIHKGHDQLAVTSSSTATLLLQSGALLSPHKMHALQASDAWADLSDSTLLLVHQIKKTHHASGESWLFQGFSLGEMPWFGYDTGRCVAVKRWYMLRCSKRQVLFCIAGMQLLYLLKIHVL
jgi:hypothetical protein